LGVDGARYQSLEFTGDISSLSMDDRFTIANMAIEAGAKNGIFPVDSLTLEYLAAHGGSPGVSYTADPDAHYTREIVLQLEEVPLTVAFPHLPENAKTIQEAEEAHIAIDQVVIGSCTNGRISDMRAAAEILKGRTVSEYVRCIIIPATQAVWKQCVEEGLMDIFIDAGAAVSTPTCGPCLGGHMGILAAGERCVSTTNRNFVGRMGHVESEVYLASPAVAAASAVTGYITGPRSL
jgi:3-isopropylmalate/(R)-2-methylmalate dehydratase large subunit